MKMKGIYQIKSPDGKIYIGQSSDLDLRFRIHRNLKKYSKGNLLHQSFECFGKSAHLFAVLYQLPNDVKGDVLDNYESFFISQFKDAKFELLNQKFGGLNGKWMDEYKEKLLGKIVTEETKAVLRESMQRRKPWVGRKHNEAARKKMAIAAAGNKRNNKKVLNSNTGIVYESLTDAAESVGMTMKALCNHMTGKAKNKHGFMYV